MATNSISRRIEALEREKGVGKFAGITTEEHADALAVVKAELRAEFADALAVVKAELRAEFADALGQFRGEVNEALADLDEAEDTEDADDETEDDGPVGEYVQP